MHKAHAKEVIDKLQILLPEILAWIDGYIEANAHRAVPVADLNFPRLVKYFSPERLANSKVVHAGHIQMPPLTRMGFPYFSDFEKMKFIGITFKDTFFLSPGAYESESTHFHELVHIIQWDFLGPEKFLAVYAIYLLSCKLCSIKVVLFQSWRTGSEKRHYQWWKNLANQRPRLRPPYTADAILYV
jgi:hypothetical protein